MDNKLDDRLDYLLSDICSCLHKIDVELHAANDYLHFIKSYSQSINSRVGNVQDHIAQIEEKFGGTYM